MTDIAIFPFCPQEVIKIESDALDCNQMNQIDFKSNLSSENSSQASSCELEIESENKVDDCSIHVVSSNDQQNNNYLSYNQNDFNDNSYIYNNDNVELKCGSNYQRDNDPSFFNNNFIPWSVEEDEIIKDFMKRDQKFYKNQMKESMPNVWARLANIPLLMSNKRTAKDIKQRWILHLDPFAAEERIKGPWTIEEDILLAKLHDIYGNSWNKIVSFIPGRTESSIKTRWNTHLKAKIRSKLENQASTLTTSKMISTPSNLLNSLFQSDLCQGQISENKKAKNRSDYKSSCQYLIIDDLDDNDLSENLILDDCPLFLEVCKSRKKAKFDNENQNKSCQSIKSNVGNKEKSVLFDCEMLPQIKSPNMNSPFTFFGPWPNIYSSPLNSTNT